MRSFLCAPADAKQAIRVSSDVPQLEAGEVDAQNFFLRRYWECAEWRRRIMSGKKS